MLATQEAGNVTGHITSQVKRSTTKRVMDQPVANEETPTVTCAGPLRRGPDRSGGHSQEDGVGGGAVFYVGD